MKKISIIIVEDHTLVRNAMAFLLNNSNQLEVIAECESGEDALEKAVALKPDQVILDINLPGIDGVETARQLTLLSPTSSILAFSEHAHVFYARRMMDAGAKGYITKTSALEEIFTAIHEIQKGKKYICEEIKNKLAEKSMMSDWDEERTKKLTDREKEIILFMQKGLSSKDLAINLKISKKTVEVHRYNIFKKLNVRNSISLLNYIHDNPLIMSN